MDIQVAEYENDIKWIQLRGRLDMQGSLAVDVRFTSLTAIDASPVIIDISEVEFIASIGMRLLLSNAKAKANRGGRMVLCQPQPLVREALQTAGIDTLIAMYDSIEAAASALRQ
jgi:anti-anti-sigma factor